MEHSRSRVPGVKFAAVFVLALAVVVTLAWNGALAWLLLHRLNII